MLKNGMMEILNQLHEFLYGVPEGHEGHGDIGYLFKRMDAYMKQKKEGKFDWQQEDNVKLATDGIVTISTMMKSYNRGKARGLPEGSDNWKLKFLASECKQILDCIKDILALAGTEPAPVLMQGVIDAMHSYRTYIRSSGMKSYHLDGYSSLVNGRNQHTKGIPTRESRHRAAAGNLFGKQRRRRRF